MSCTFNKCENPKLNGNPFFEGLYAMCICGCELVVGLVINFTSMQEEKQHRS